jgi:nucleoside-diphosphate-sugar epimerase
VGNLQKHLFSIPAGDLDEILRAAAADLEALRGSQLFITGGTGFFGKWLLAALLSANDQLDLGLALTILSRRPIEFQRKYPEVDRGDIRFLGSHVADFPTENRRFDYLIHAATDTTAFTREADENERARAIVAGTQRMLDLARESGVRRILNISSGAVYGAACGKPGGAREDDYDAARPATAYGLAKREAEALCGESKLDFVTARAFAFLGPHLPLEAHFAAGNFLLDALRGGPICVRGDGTALRSYLYPADLIVWLLRLLVRGVRGSAYNVGSDEAVSTAELARLIASAVEPKAEVLIQSVQPQGPQNIYLPNIDRARAELQLDVAVPLREAVGRTLAYLNRSD